MSFWQDTLGLEVAADWSDDDHGAAALTLGNSHLIVAEQEKQREIDFGFSTERGRVYIYVQVRGLDALVAHLEDQNVRGLHGPVQLHWGPRLVTAQDPDGVPILFVEGDPDSDLVARFSKEST